MERVLVYTDGACDPNPGKGGWGVVVVESDGSVRKLKGSGTGRTTNNRMEMTAVLMALRALSRPEAEVIVHCDSQLVIRTLCGRYRRNKNLDLWNEIDAELKRFPTIGFKWVPGHAGVKYNEIADQLASEGAAVTGGLPARMDGHAEKRGNGLRGEIDRSRPERAGKDRPSLKCHRCRCPMRLLPHQGNASDEQLRFRCDTCGISAYKDRRGAHYFRTT